MNAQENTSKPTVTKGNKVMYRYYLLFIFLFIVWYFNAGRLDQYMVYVIPVLSIGAIILAFKYRHKPQEKVIQYSEFEIWALRRGFRFWPRSTRNKRIATLLNASTAKNYFNFKNVFLMRRDPFNRYWCAEGAVRGRRVTVFSTSVGFCVDVATVPIPVFVRAMHRFFGAPDKLDVESNSFEERYDLNTKREGVVLQLLDPVMITLLDKSRIVGIEFGDSSVAMYRSFLFDLSDFDAMIETGVEIAEQVDRNFPMGKHEKV